MIVTNVGGLPEIVPNDVVGFEEPEPTPIADAILKFYRRTKGRSICSEHQHRKRKIQLECYAEKHL